MKEVSMQPKIIYNVANAPLLSLQGRQFTALGRMLDNAGYDGISALPFRRETLVEDYAYYFPPVILVEDAWNPGGYDNLGLAIAQGIAGHFRRLLGDESEPPLLQDTLFFPSKETSKMLANQLMDANPDAHFGSTVFNSGFAPERTYVHIQHDYKPHTMSTEELLDTSQKTESMLLFDPTHLLSEQSISLPQRPTRKNASAWEQQLNFFAERIAGVDIHAASRAELEEFLKESGKLYELAQAGFAICHSLDFMRVESLVPLEQQISPAWAYHASEYIKRCADILKQLRDQTGA